MTRNPRFKQNEGLISAYMNFEDEIIVKILVLTHQRCPARMKAVPSYAVASLAWVTVP
jgi:hypothetical protein